MENKKFSKKLEKIPEYPMLLVGKKSKEVEKRDGIKVINARIGIPDKEAPKIVKSVLAKYVLKKNSTFGYPCDAYPERGIPELIEAIINDYYQKYNVKLSQENIVVVGWTKPILYYLSHLFDKGNILVPEPVYPVYVASTIVSDHNLKIIPTSEKNGWLPQFSFENDDVAFYFCDPHNPTATIADKNFYLELLKKMKEKGIVGVFDKAYKDFLYDSSTKTISIVQIPEMLDFGYEVVSFSKHFNFVGIGAGWVVSSKENIDRLLKFLGNFTQGVPYFVQKAALEALTNQKVKKEMKEYFQELKKRRDIFVKGLNELGLECKAPLATPYLWIKSPQKYPDDKEFVLNIILDKAHVAFMPGSFFGESGKGYFRATLYISEKEIKEVLQKIKKIRDW